MAGIASYIIYGYLMPHEQLMLVGGLGYLAWGTYHLTKEIVQ
jgi:hypothetical protein